MHHGNHNDEAVGSIIGAALGFINAINLGNYANEIDTIRLAAIGAITGFAVTHLLKWLKKKFSKQ